VRWSGYVVLEGYGCIAAWVGLHQAQALAWQCRRVEVDQEGAVGQDSAGADHITLGVAHLHAGTRFTTAAQGQAIAADDNIAHRCRRRDVRCIEWQRGRGVTGGVHQADIQHFAIGLGRRKREAEAAAFVDQAGTDDVARSIAHLHGGARFAATREGDAVDQFQAGRLLWRL